MTPRTLMKYAAAALVLAVTFAGGTLTASATTKPEPQPAPEIPHCATEDGGPQPVCIWDSAVDGNGQPAAPNNVVILYVTRPGQDPEPIRLK